MLILKSLQDLPMRPEPCHKDKSAEAAASTLSWAARKAREYVFDKYEKIDRAPVLLRRAQHKFCRILEDHNLRLSKDVQDKAFQNLIIDRKCPVPGNGFLTIGDVT